MSLFDPVVFRGGRTARNRLAVAPLTNQQSHADGSLSDDELRWLELRGRGGFGAVITCAAHVALDGQGWPGELGVFDDRLVPGLTRVADALRAAGALSFVQLFHGGVRSPSSLIGQPPWSASSFQEESSEFEVPRAGTVEDIERVLAEFVAAARRCAQAGFDGVELHGAHGYLLSQFLSRTMNPRTDGWGGSLEGRARLVREVTRGIRSALPAPFVLGIRLSPEDFGNARGLDLDETVQVARWLCEDGLDFVHLSLWRALETSRKRPAEHPLPLFRAAIPSDVKLLAAGSIWTRAEAEQLIELGADIVALGRAAIANPDWPLRAAAPDWEPRRPPLTRAELQARGLSDSFVTYMKRWKGFVDEA